MTYLECRKIDTVAKGVTNPKYLVKMQYWLSLKIELQMNMTIKNGAPVLILEFLSSSVFSMEETGPNFDFFVLQVQRLVQTAT